MRKLLDFYLNKREVLRAKVQAFLAREDAIYYRNKKEHERRFGYFFMWLALFFGSLCFLIVWGMSLWNR